MPPPPWTDHPPLPVNLDTPDADQFGTPLALLIDLVFGDETHQALLELRLESWLQQQPPQLTAAQQRIAEAVETRKAHLVRHALGDLQRWQTQLRALANHLEDLEQRSAASD